MDMEKWAPIYSDRDYKRVALTEGIDDGEHIWTVSTVWLGLDHNWDDSGRTAPLIFETMGWYNIEPIKNKDKYPELFDGTIENFPRFSGWEEQEINHEFSEWQFRWATESRALRGHQEVIAWLLKEGPEPHGDYGLPYEIWYREIATGNLS